MKVIEFNTVTGLMIQTKIGEQPSEGDIEFTYKDLLIYMSSCISIYKQGFTGTRAKTDGRILVKVGNNSYREGLIEAKYKKPKTINELKKHLVQALHYNYFNATTEFQEYDFFIFPTEWGISYVTRESIKSLINKLFPLFKSTSYSPSSNWKDLKIREVMKNWSPCNMNTVEITEDFRLDKYMVGVMKAININKFKANEHRGAN